MTQTIDVTQSPLSIYESVRVVVPSDGAWHDVYSPPRYRVAATPTRPEYIDQTAAIVTHCYCAHTGSSGTNVAVSVRISDDNGDFPIVLDQDVPGAALFSLDMRRAVVNSDVAATLQVRAVGANDLNFHLSVIRQTQERV